MQLEYRADIDGLRAIAVSVVVIYHLQLGLFTGGFVGVDVFFAISGFLITKLIIQGLEKDSFSILNFYSRRFRRLFPALIFTLAFSTLLAAALLTSHGFREYGRELVASVLSISNFYFWSSAGYFDTAAIQKPLLHTWSLSVEEQFYLFWPAILILVSKFRALKYVPLLLIFLIFSSLIAAEIMVQKNPTTAFYLLPFRAFELALGGILAVLPKINVSSKLMRSGISCIGLGMICFSVVMYTHDTPFPGLSALLPCFGTFLIIYAGPDNHFSAALSNRFFVFTGLISYSWYLIHWPIIVFWKYFTFKEFSTIEAAGLLVVSYLIAAFMYKYIETPVRKAKSIKFSNRHLVASLTVIMLGFGVMGVLIDKSGGFPTRIKTVASAWDVRQGLSKQTELTKNLKAKMSYGRFDIRGSRSDEHRKIMIVGDSHAGRLAAFGFYFHEQETSQIIMAWRTGCFPLLAMKASSAAGGIQGVNCRWTRNHFMSAILENNVDTVILAGRWLPYLGGEYPSQEESKKRYFIKDDKKIEDVAYALNYFEAMLDETLHHLSENGVKVILVSQIPPPLGNLRGCNEIPTWLVKAERQIERCKGRETSEVLETLKPLNDVMTRVADKYGQLAILPSDYFCLENSPRCIAHYKGRALYSDDNHINKYGAHYLAEKSELEVTSFLQ